MNNLLSISDRAALQIKKIISECSETIDGVVIGIDKTGCSGYSYKINYANKKECEKYDLIDTKGVRVYVEPSASMFLIGSEMDYSIDKLASRFVFNNPNEKNTCGCGESFNI